MHRHVFHPENRQRTWPQFGKGGPFSARLFLLLPVEVAARQPLCGPGKRMDVNPSVPHMTKLQCVWKPGTEHGRFVVFNFFFSLEDKPSTRSILQPQPCSTARWQTTSETLWLILFFFLLTVRRTAPLPLLCSPLLSPSELYRDVISEHPDGAQVSGREEYKDWLERLHFFFFFFFFCYFLLGLVPCTW